MSNSPGMVRSIKARSSINTQSKKWIDLPLAIDLDSLAS